MADLVRRDPRQPVIRPQNFAELLQFAKMAAASQFVPKEYQGKPEAIMLAVQMGSELGLAPMQALQNIAVINGRPCLWGDAIPGLIRSSGNCHHIREWYEGEGDELTAYCEMQRKDAKDIYVSKFSIADAKRADLWDERPKVRRKGKDGAFYETDNDSTWHCYPERMLMWRARGFAARDAFPDVLKGLISREEARDIPTVEHEPDAITQSTDRRERLSRALDIVDGKKPAPEASAPPAHDELAGDAIPAWDDQPADKRLDLLNDPSMTADALRERVDEAIKAYASVMTSKKFVTAKALTEQLFQDVKTAGRPDLYEMLDAARAAAEQRAVETAARDAENFS